MVTYTFTNGTVADADEVNQNFTDSLKGFAYGLTPTQEGDWSVTATNLGNITDGSLTTSSTTATIIGGSQTADIIIDLGSVETAMIISAKYGYSATDVYPHFRVRYGSTTDSMTDISEFNVNGNAGTSTTARTVSLDPPVSARYFSFRLYVDAPSGGNNSIIPYHLGVK